jgi:hypothetical protein
MPQHLPGDDDNHDDLAAALSFSGAAESDDDSDEESALRAYAPTADADEESALGTLHAYAPAEPEDTATELDTIRSQAQASDEEEEDEESAVQLFTVTNPPQTVSVSALIDGRTQQIDLSPKLSMTEAELKDEVLVLAELARQKGLAGQHTYLLDNDFLSESLSEMGVDGNDFLRDFMETGMGMPTPEQAAEAQAEVFATRYGADGSRADK